MPPAPLPRSFFQRDFLAVARDLLGARVIRDDLSASIVEVEAYGVTGDPACHMATRPTTRAFFAAQQAGDAYIYLNYGCFWLLNMLVKNESGPGRDGLILIRALQPLTGLETMRSRRPKCLKDHQLCAGPGRLSLACGLDRSWHGHDLTDGTSSLYLAQSLPAAAPPAIAADVRVGISRAADFPWRFVIPGHPCLSIPFGKVKPPKTSLPVLAPPAL